jgi:DeoR/GlpR family transcriptional regulator of sugar metabolism
LEIAEKAAQLIKKESLVYFDDGSTVQKVATFLPPDLQFTAMTRQLATAQELIEFSAANVLLIGGRIDRRDGVTNSPRILQEIGSSRFDLLLLGVCSLDEQEGLGARTPEEMELKRALLKSSGKVAALVTADKFGTAAPFLVGEPALLDYLVTDEPEKGSSSL